MKELKFLVVVFFLTNFSQAYAYNPVVGEAAQRYVKPLETILVDGPFYVGGVEYYMVDYMYSGEVTDSLVYDIVEKSFVSDKELAKKVFATRDMAILTLIDPLFYAPGDPSNIPLAAKYETQNVRNFAAYVPMTLQEGTRLERFLQSYENLARDIAEINILTNGILYPGGSLPSIYGASSQPSTRQGLERNFSYEGFEELLASYRRLSADYDVLVINLQELSETFEGYQVDTPVREKWGVVISTENIKEQVELVEENGRVLEGEISFREEILKSNFEEELKGLNRLSIVPRAGKGYLIVFPILVLAVYLVLRKKVRPPGIIIFLLLLMPVSFAATEEIKIHTPSELLSQKVRYLSEVGLTVYADDLSEGKAKRILAGYPLLLMGERAEVRGPYFISNTSYYLYEIFRDQEHTGNGFLVKSETELLEPDQGLVFRAIKARFISERVSTKPLYTVDESKIEKRAKNATIPLDLFLTNLSVNVREGKEIEKRLSKHPDFEDVEAIMEHYTSAFTILRSIGMILPEDEADEITSGLFSQMKDFESNARLAQGLSAEEYLAGRSSMYRARTLNRLPVIQQVGAIGFGPTMPQLIQDLTSDLIYDNYFLWRIGRVKDASLFIRLPFKEGTVTFPSQVEAGQ